MWGGQEKFYLLSLNYFAYYRPNQKVVHPSPKYCTLKSSLFVLLFVLLLGLIKEVL